MVDRHEPELPSRQIDVHELPPRRADSDGQAPAAAAGQQSYCRSAAGGGHHPFWVIEAVTNRTRRRATAKDSNSRTAATIAVTPKIADRLRPACCSGPTPNAAMPYPS